ncbi:hypothetical protein KFK09_011736 [Dendrobium nobile]|uniref:DUF4283 domain-containing protein n=1 Tax=Dendrobium nobile TaxID=94219 RepID=A0A8T3BFC8_DENNO|nr:hypothetical protein KFK09_011736 [Dendrobium nobile]
MTSPTLSTPVVPPILTGKTRSFKDVVSSGSSSTISKVQFVHSSFKGCPALLFEDTVVQQLATPFSFTLVGKFMLHRPNLDVIRKFFHVLKLSGSFNVNLLDSKHIAVQLSNDLDYSHIFSCRSYYIQGCQMRLLKWSPDFDVWEEPPIAPVWIAFPNLRLYFFNSHILFGLASVFGRPLQTDQATASLSRPSVARVLVELDVTKKHPHEIWLGSEMNGYFQKVEIEYLPIFCSHCKKHGHEINECFRLHPNLRKDKSLPKVNENVVSKVLHEPIPPLEDNIGLASHELGNANCGNEGEENVIHNSALSNISKPASINTVNAINDNVSQETAVQIPSSIALHDANNILEQEKWVNAKIVNSSNDLVVVS